MWETCLFRLTTMLRKECNVMALYILHCIFFQRFPFEISETFSPFTLKIDNVEQTVLQILPY